MRKLDRHEAIVSRWLWPPPTVAERLLRPINLPHRANCPVRALGRSLFSTDRRRFNVLAAAIARRPRFGYLSRISRNDVCDQIGHHLPFTFCNEIDWFSVIQKLIWHS